MARAWAKGWHVQWEAVPPGIDGVTFAVVEARGVEKFLDQLREEMLERTYRPQRARKVEIPKGGGKMRQLSIPTIQDRVVQRGVKAHPGSDL
jgi:RNA-directed DNA polymerase